MVYTIVLLTIVASASGETALSDYSVIDASGTVLGSTSRAFAAGRYDGETCGGPIEKLAVSTVEEVALEACAKRCATISGCTGFNHNNGPKNVGGRNCYFFDDTCKAFLGIEGSTNAGFRVVPLTTAPTLAPTSTPTQVPTLVPSWVPTSAPSSTPTTAVPTLAPTLATSTPTHAPTSVPSWAPTSAPSSTRTMSEETALSDYSVIDASGTVLGSTSRAFAAGRYDGETCGGPIEKLAVSTVEEVALEACAKRCATISGCTGFNHNNGPKTAGGRNCYFFDDTCKAFLGIEGSTNAGFRVVPLTTAPTLAPTSTPTQVPTLVPSWVPTSAPSSTPTTAVPTLAPTLATSTPTHAPTSVPSWAPTATPSTTRTMDPSKQPTAIPTSSHPSQIPTALPSTASPITLSFSPSLSPTTQAVLTPQPTAVPNSAAPIVVTTMVPTPALDAASNSRSPSMAPTSTNVVIATGVPTSDADDTANNSDHGVYGAAGGGAAAFVLIALAVYFTYQRKRKGMMQRPGYVNGFGTRTQERRETTLEINMMPKLALPPKDPAIITSQINPLHDKVHFEQFVAQVKSEGGVALADAYRALVPGTKFIGTSGGSAYVLTVRYREGRRLMGDHRGTRSTGTGFEGRVCIEIRGDETPGRINVTIEDVEGVSGIALRTGVLEVKQEAHGVSFGQITGRSFVLKSRVIEKSAIKAKKGLSGHFRMPV